MRKYLFTLSLVVALVMSFTVVSLAAENRTGDTLDIDMAVVNPYVFWDGLQSFTINVDATEGFNNTYVIESAFAVRSSTSYRVKVNLNVNYDVWTTKGVLMNVGNNKAIHKVNQYQSAFDIAIWDRAENEYSRWFRGAAGQVELTQELKFENTLGIVEPQNEYVHGIAIALVLVDEDTEPAGLTSGTQGVRRFEELPAGDYFAYVRVTIVEDVL